MLDIKFASFAFAFAAVSLSIVACSSSDDSSGAGTSQAGSRDEAASVSCDFYTRCNEIGAGKTYETADQCSVKQRANWDSLWPTQDCDGKINAEAYKLCLDTIRTAECGNAADLANVLFNKCPKSKVCAGQ